MEAGNSDKLSAQQEEAEVLKSIYGDDFVFRSGDKSNSCEILVRPSERDEILPLRLCVYFPENYPLTSEPVFEMDAPWLQNETIELLGRGLHKISEDSPGTVLVFSWVEWIKEQAWLWEEASIWALSQHISNLDKAKSDIMHLTINSDDNGGSDLNAVQEDAYKVLLNQNLFMDKDEKSKMKGHDIKELEELDRILGITHGAPFTEKRSTFQAHLACVNTSDQVETVMEALLQNRKIAGATHNIMAYRIIIPEKGTVLQDYDDDGETAAGGRLLHLLQITDATNVVVVVSRWFGGILLGPDRFKHINNAARSLLSSCGYIKGSGPPGATSDKQRSQSKAHQKGKKR